jgi:hypothetical protein
LWLLLFGNKTNPRGRSEQNNKKASAQLVHSSIHPCSIQNGGRDKKADKNVAAPTMEKNARARLLVQFPNRGVMDRREHIKQSDSAPPLLCGSRPTPVINHFKDARQPNSLRWKRAKVKKVRC